MPLIFDEWAVRFYDEMNYVKESENVIRFLRLMQTLKDVTSPLPFFEYTSKRVMVMEWVDGNKLVENTLEE